MVFGEQIAISFQIFKSGSSIFLNVLNLSGQFIRVFTATLNTSPECIHLQGSLRSFVATLNILYRIGVFSWGCTPILWVPEAPRGVSFMHSNLEHLVGPIWYASSIFIEGVHLRGPREVLFMGCFMIRVRDQSSEFGEHIFWRNLAQSFKSMEHVTK